MATPAFERPALCRIEHTLWATGFREFSDAHAWTRLMEFKSAIQACARELDGQDVTATWSGSSLTIDALRVRTGATRRIFDQAHNDGLTVCNGWVGYGSTKRDGWLLDRDGRFRSCASQSSTISRTFFTGTAMLHCCDLCRQSSRHVHEWRMDDRGAIHHRLVTLDMAVHRCDRVTALERLASEDHVVFSRVRFRPPRLATRVVQIWQPLKP